MTMRSAGGFGVFQNHRLLARAQTGPAKMSTTLEIYTISVPQAQRKAVENLAHLYRVKVPSRSTVTD